VLTNSLMSILNMDGTGDKLPFRRIELYKVAIGNYIFYLCTYTTYSSILYMIFILISMCKINGNCCYIFSGAI